jgi:hypothetical protein
MPNPQSPVGSNVPTRFHVGSLVAIAAGAVILLIVLGTLPRIPW